MTASNPQPDDPRTPGKAAGPEDVKRGLRTILLVLLAVIVVAAIAVALTNIGGDDDPSGGDEQGMAPVVLEVTRAG